MYVRKRKRGIRASREKLEAAMVANGFESQAALANKIAQNEGIEKPPRDLVNKVFREQAVSTHNLARVAKALDIEAHTIYLAADDSQFSATLLTQTTNSQAFKVAPEAPQKAQTLPSILDNNDNDTSANIHRSNASRNTSFSKRRLVTMLTTSALFLSAIVYFLWPEDNLTSVSYAKIKATTGKIRVVVQSIPALSFLANEIEQQFTNGDKISALMTNVPNTYHLSAYQALDNWQAHLVLKLSLVQERYYALVTASLGSKQRNQMVFQSIVRISEMNKNTQSMSKALVGKTQQMINGEALSVSMTESNQALSSYLRGKDLLFLSHSVTSYLSARDYFASAIQIDPNFAAPYAELCRTYVRVSWIKDEASFLEKAAEFCQQAETLNADSLLTTTAKAELFTRIGKAEDAIALLQDTVSLNTKNADALAIRAAIHLELYEQLARDEDAKLVKSYALKAIEVEPKHWLAYNTLGNLYFATGQTKKAKESFAAASDIVKHEVIMANLGTLQMCFNELESAKQTYINLIANFENNAIGYENLGAVYFFNQDYHQALKHKLTAIKKQPDISIHQVWSALAEIYLRLKNDEKAQQFYTKAVTLVERDELLENTSMNDELHKLYYLTKLALIKGNKIALEEFDKQLPPFLAQENKLGLKARSHLAWLAGLMGYTADRDRIWMAISKTCPVYEHSPELLLQAATN